MILSFEAIPLTLEDSMLVIASAVIVAALIISVMVLARFRLVAAQAVRSNDLAEDLWNSLESRLRKQDERIVDLIARVEITEVRSEMRKSSSSSILRDTSTGNLKSGEPKLPSSGRSVMPSASVERIILERLIEGPKTSTQIKTLIAKSREHTARLLKTMFDSGFVIRNNEKRPFVYEITDLGKRHLEDSLSVDK